MGNVVSFPGKEEDYMSGGAKCIHCGHEWVADTPVGVITLKCPECKFLKGAFVCLAEPDERWVCNCGNDLYFISADGCMCSKCGVVQVFGDS